MALSFFKSSRHRGNTVDCFEFVYGDSSEDDAYRYTNTERPLVFDGKTFDALAIERDSIKSKGREMGGQFNVKVPRTSGIAQLFQGLPPRRVVFLRVYEGDAPEADTPEGWASGPTPVLDLIWSGRVLEAQHKSDITVLSCDNLGAGMKRPGLNRFYQRECPHVLYGLRCQADEAAATSTFTSADAPEGRTIRLTGGWPELSDADRGNHIGGILRFTGPVGQETRRIVDVSANFVTVDSPVGGLLSEGDALTVSLGCPRTPEACVQLHNNIQNYGGMPYIPELDPHGKNNHT